MNDIQTSWWARVYWNEKFLCINACSGRGMMQGDPDSAQHLLPLDVDDETLGRAVRDALAHSRLLTMEEIAAFFNPAYSKEKYDGWVAGLMTRYSYKTRRALFKHMLSCGAGQRDGAITFSPSRHDCLEGWGRTKGDIAEGMTDEVIADSESSEAVGAALRRAMSRCR